MDCNFPSDCAVVSFFLIRLYFIYIIAGGSVISASLNLFSLKHDPTFYVASSLKNMRLLIVRLCRQLQCRETLENLRKKGRKFRKGYHHSSSNSSSSVSSGSSSNVYLIYFSLLF